MTVCRTGSAGSRGLAVQGCIEHVDLGTGITVREVDREIAFALLSRACRFDRIEIDQVVAYVVHVDGIEVGRVVIAPGTEYDPQVRIREHHTLLEQSRLGSRQTTNALVRMGEKTGHLSGEFVDLCAHIRRALESLPAAENTILSTECGRVPRQASGGAYHRYEAQRDSDHFAYPRPKRLEIVQHYREDRINGDVGNKERWARQHYQISGRTLSNYEREFAEVVQ